MKTASYITSLSLTALTLFSVQVPSQSAPTEIPEEISLDAQLKNAMSRFYRDSKKPIALLKAGANPNEYNGDLFNWALIAGNEQLVRSFIQHGAKVTSKSLGAALSSEQNTHRITEILLNRGASPNAPISYSPLSQTGNPAILQTPLMLALQYDHSEAAMLLIQRGANIHTRLKNGYTALKAAALHNNLSFCKFLLDRNVDFEGSEKFLLNATIKKNDLLFFDRLQKLNALPKPVLWPPIYETVSLPMARKLVAVGAKPNLNPKFRDFSPLLSATSRNDLPFAQFLVNLGAKIDGEILLASIPEYYKSPSIMERERATIRAYYSKNSDPLGNGVSEDEYLKEVKNAPDDLRLLKFFLEKGANPNQKTYWQQKDTPLHIAASRNRKNAIALLLKYGANIEAKDETGETPLFYAIEKGSVEAVKFLLDNGANIEAQDFTGQTPLMKALEVGGITNYAPIVTFASGTPDISLFDYLIKRGAYINANMTNGVSALHIAAASGNIVAVRTLLKNGAALEARTSKTIYIHDKIEVGATPLFFAVSAAEIEGVKILLDAGANPDAETKSGLTPRKLAKRSHVTEFKVNIAGGENIRETPETKAYREQEIAAMKQNLRKLDEELTRRREQILKSMKKR